MDLECKGTSLYIDIVLQSNRYHIDRKPYDYRMRSSMIWFWRIFCCICDLSGLFSDVFSLHMGRRLVLLDHLRIVNMIWHLLHKSYLSDMMLWSGLLWCRCDLDLLWCCDLLWCRCGLFYSCYTDADVICFKSVILLLHYEVRCFIHDAAALVTNVWCNL